jgi:hypothetical protein
MSNNTFHDDGTGMVWVSNTNGGGSIGPVVFSNNTLDGFSVWNTSADCYHEDGIHCWDSPGYTPVHYNGVYVYDNRWSGMGGPTTTGYIFLEGGNVGSATICADNTSDFWIFNNVFTSTAGLGNGLIEPTSSRPHVLNNTANGNDTTAGACLVWNQGDIGPGSVENNVFSSCSSFVYDSNQQPLGTLDSNVYANGGGSAWRWGSNTMGFTSGSFSSWKSDTGGDAHSMMTSNADLNSDGSLQSGSPAIGMGTNLTSLCTGNLTALCTEINGTPRPTTGAWDAGAY